MTAIAPQTDLAVLAHRIRTEWDGYRSRQIEAWQGQLAVGTLLMKARQLHPGDREYGRWLEEQDFDFSRQWANRLVRLAENRPAVEALLETAVSGGASPPGVNTLLAILRASLNPQLGQPEQNGSTSPPPLIAQPDHHRSTVVDIIVNFPVGTTRREEGAPHGNGPPRREWACEIVMQEDAPQSLMDVRPFVTELGQRLMRELAMRPLDTMKR